MGHILGDKYRVFYSIGGGTLSGGVHDRWDDAKAERGTIFDTVPGVRAVWVMKDNPSLGSAPRLHGFTMRRRKQNACTS